MAYCCCVFVPAVADVPVVVRVVAVAGVTTVAENLCAVFLNDFTIPLTHGFRVQLVAPYQIMTT
jgi:hypothetical protein